MVRSIRSSYEGELMDDNGHNHDDVETYRIERTEIIRHGGTSHDGHDEHLAHAHNHGHNIHGNKHKHKYEQNLNPHHHRLGENAVPALVQAFSGAIGASIANLAVHPLDLIIKRLQVQRQIQMQHRTHIKRQTSGRGSPRRQPPQEHSRSRSRGESSEHVILGVGSEGRDEGRMRGSTGEHQFSSTTVIEETTTVEHVVEEFDMEEYTGVLDAARKIYQHEGIGGFYTGAVEETVGTMGSAFWYFAVYSYLRNKRLHKRHTQKLPILEELVIGLAAGSVSKIFLTPFNTIATRKQTHAMYYPNSRAPGIVDVCRDIQREKGLIGFWSGYSASAFLSLNPTITFLLYESLKNFAGGKRRRLRGAETFLLAAVAKAIATGMTYPLAVARSRAQLSTETDDFGYNDLTDMSKVGQHVKNRLSKKVRRSGNVIHVLVEICKTEGITGLYEGVLGELLRGFVSSGITLVIKESVHRTIISIYFFVMRAYNRTSDHTFQSTAGVIAKDAYNKAGPRQKKIMNKAIEGAEKVVSSTSHGKAKVAGLVGAGVAAHKLAEVREKISEKTGIGKHHREGSSHSGVKTAAAVVAATGLAAGAIHAHKKHNERHDEHGNVIVHTARERVEEWREGVDDDRIHTGQVSHSHGGHIVDDRIHTGEMRQEVIETRIHSGSGNAGSRIGRHNGVTEHTHIEEHIEHGHSGSGSHSRRGSAGVIGAVTGGALGHKLSSHSHTEHNHSNSHGNQGGIIDSVTGGALGHKVSSHSHTEHGHSNSHGNQGGLIGTVTGGAIGHKLSNHSHTEHSHSNSHGNHGGLIGAVTGGALGHKLSSHGHNEHSHSSSHGGLASGVVGAVTGAALGNKLSHSSGHGLASGVVGAVTGAVAGAALGNKISGHSHNEHSHSSNSHGNHGGLIGAITGSALGHKVSGHSHTEHGHSNSHGNQGGLIGTVTGGALGHKVSSHSHTEHGHSNSHGNQGGLIGAVTGGALGHKVSSHSHTEHSHSNSHGNQGGLIGTATGGTLGHKVSSHSHTEHSHSNSHGNQGGLIGAVTGGALGHKLSSHSHQEHSHNSSSNHGGLATGVVGAVTGAALGHKLSSHSHNEHGHGHSGHSHSHHGGDIVTTTIKTVEEYDSIVKDPRIPLTHNHHDGRFGETSHHEHTSIHESRGREHGGIVGAVAGAVERVTGHGHNSHGRSHSGSRHGHGRSSHGHDGQTILHTTETVKEWRDEANAVEDLRQFGVASTVNEDSRSDFGETLHKGHSIVGHGHTNRFGDDSVVHNGHGVIEKTHITRIDETLRDSGHRSHSHGSHGHRHKESHSNFGDATLLTDGRTVVEKTQVTRIGGALHDGHHSHRHGHRHNDSAIHTDGRTIIEKTEITRTDGTDAHSYNGIPSRSPLSRFEDAAISKVVEKTQVTRFGEAHHDADHKHHRSHSSHNHGHNNSLVVGKAGHDSTVNRTTIRETGWLGKKALVNNTSSINTAAATAGSNGVTTVTRTEEFWPIDEDARSSIYNFLDEESKEMGGVKIVETRTAEERWWDDKRGKGYN